MVSLIKVKASYLEQLLQSKNPNTEEILKYFDLVESSPFNLDLKLKENIEIIPDEGEALSLGAKDWALNFLNNRSRKKRHKRYYEFTSLHPETPRIVSEGDSWFQHPLVEDIIDHLLSYYPIFSLGAGGDTLRNMHRKAEIERAIKAIQPDFLLLSGGGNDILGEQFYYYLNDYSAGFPPGQNPGRFLNERFATELENLSKIYLDICSSLTALFPNLKIITHGYDNIIPNNPNVPKKWYLSTDKSWLGDPMEKRGITNQEDKEAIIRYILTIFNRNLMSAEKKLKNVFHLDLRDTVQAHQWEDEIHPNKDGFQNIALIFKEKIRTLTNIEV